MFHHCFQIYFQIAGALYRFFSMDLQPGCQASGSEMTVSTGGEVICPGSGEYRAARQALSSRRATALA